MVDRPHDAPVCDAAIVSYEVSDHIVVFIVCECPNQSCTFTLHSNTCAVTRAEQGGKAGTLTVCLLNYCTLRLAALVRDFGEL